MELTFDYYKNVQDVEIYLCNPDRSVLGELPAKNRNVVLRFNNISEIKFEVPKYVTNTKGEKVEHPYYTRVSTKRLVKVDKIGWFRINQALENESSAGAYKSVTAESHQCTFKDIGFVEENRLYKFYDEKDPRDEKYNDEDVGAIPSVVGQLYQQLGIVCNLEIGDITPTVDYEKWTIIWIEDALKYDASKESNVCRTLKGSDELFGYDFMVNDVEDAFQVIFEFDFLHHAIKIKSAESATERTNIYLSFDNLMQNIEVTEKSDEIVTVLSCNGKGLDITSVNPIGTNYICDFSYFMGNENDGYPWMSKELSEKLRSWEDIVEEYQSEYSEYVDGLYNIYLNIAEANSEFVLIDTKLQDLDKARDSYIENQSEYAEHVFIVEAVEKGEKSLDKESKFYSYTFPIAITTEEKMEEILQAAQPKNGRYFYVGNTTDKYEKNYAYSKQQGEFIKVSGTWKCYKTQPTVDENGEYTYENVTDYIIGDNLQDCFAQSEEHIYFIDGNKKSYCKLKQSSALDKDGNAIYFVSGFERWSKYKNNGVWRDLWAKEKDEAQWKISKQEEAEKNILAQMKAITDKTNILSYFSKEENANLLHELRCYWADGQYTNDTLEALEGTTIAENLELAKELMSAGKTELNRVCQPRFSFTVTAANFLKMPQFVKFARELELGKVVTVQKNENTHYMPALTEISFSLDTSDNFTLVFSNSLKLTDWGYTYADLIKSVSSTARTVEANWANLTSYADEKEHISKLLYNTLDRTLRKGLDNAYAQEFVVDNTGILGRKKTDDGFEQCQLRIMNNLIVFTQDNWQTASTALGKVYYDNPDGSTTEAYGLVTDVLVGRLLLGEKLWIGNEDGSVVIDKNGVVLSKGLIASENYEYDDKNNAHYASSGMCINFDGDGEPYIRATNFALEPGGDAYFKGNLEVKSLKSDNFEISEDGIVTLRNGLIQSANSEKEPIYGDAFSEEIEFNCKRSEYVIETLQDHASQTSYFNITINGSVMVNRDGVDIVDEIEYVTLSYKISTVNNSGFPITETHTVDPFSIIEKKETADGKKIIYSYKFKTGAHGAFDTVSGCSLVIEYKARKIVDYKTAKGVIIDLGNNPYISFPKFSVDENGHMTAQSGDIGSCSIYKRVVNFYEPKLYIKTNLNSPRPSITVTGKVKYFGTITKEEVMTDFNYYLSSGDAQNRGNSLIKFHCPVELNVENSEGVAIATYDGTVLPSWGGDGEQWNYCRYSQNVYDPEDIGTIILNNITNWDEVDEATIEGGKEIEPGHAIAFYTPSGKSVAIFYVPKEEFTVYKVSNTIYGIMDPVDLKQIDGLRAKGSEVYFDKNGLTCGDYYFDNKGKAYVASLTSTAWRDEWEKSSSGTIQADDDGLFKISCTVGTGEFSGTWNFDAASGTVSDKNKKYEIREQSEEYSALFDLLKPVLFKYKNGASNRTHTGFIAQEIEEAVLASGLTTQDFAAVCYTIDDDGNKYDYSVRYDEIISLCVHEIQKLKQELKELKENENQELAYSEECNLST